MSDRLAFPAAAALAVLTLALWLYLLLVGATGVQVANRSGAVISSLTVCQGSGECLHRDRLWPHQTWRVPQAHAGEQVRVTVQEPGGTRQSVTHTPAAADPHAAFVVGRDGRIKLQ
ncbi:hypothetical protein [Deinococcus frigens]|uniref:hypothetical protein n=1 Tax=Deinococcus frigens TaxID=249403 RepID=UPI000495AB42|nr:hypothetical protein [Deinococcus frigens]